MICPKCGSKNVKETTAYAWSATCKDCGWFTDDYKPGPANAPFKSEPIKLEWEW